MIAMIFAAGLGSRLAPLTDHRPKALVEFQGKTMLENAARKLTGAGFNRLVINVHHHAGMMMDFIKSHDLGAEVMISDESDFLLDTGGGILKARRLLSSEPDFLMYNVDIACDMDISALVSHHRNSGNLATLAVMDRYSTRKLAFDSGMNLCEWHNITTGEKKIARPSADHLTDFAFSGISMANREIFGLITETGKFSITDMYLRLAQEHRIGGYAHGGLWADLGTTEKLAKAGELFRGRAQVSGEC